jgi:hypothetical protein
LVSISSGAGVRDQIIQGADQVSHLALSCPLFHQTIKSTSSCSVFTELLEQGR